MRPKLPTSSIDSVEDVDLAVAGVGQEEKLLRGSGREGDRERRAEQLRLPFDEDLALERAVDGEHLHPVVQRSAT